VLIGTSFRVHERCVSATTDHTEGVELADMLEVTSRKMHKLRLETLRARASEVWAEISANPENTNDVPERVFSRSRTVDCGGHMLKHEKPVRESRLVCVINNLKA